MENYHSVLESSWKKTLKQQVGWPGYLVLF